MDQRRGDPGPRPPPTWPAASASRSAVAASSRAPAMSPCAARPHADITAASDAPATSPTSSKSRHSRAASAASCDIAFSVGSAGFQVRTSIRPRSMAASARRPVRLPRQRLGQLVHHVLVRRLALFAEGEVGDAGAVVRIPIRLLIVVSIAVSYALQRDVGTAHDHARRAATSADEIQDGWLRAEARGALANVYRLLGRPGELAKTLREAIDLVLLAGDLTAAGVKLTQLVAASAQAGDETAALARYQDGITLLRGGGSAVYLAHGLRELARFHRETGTPAPSSSTANASHSCARRTYPPASSASTPSSAWSSWTTDGSS
jgi:hypothetical protein